MTLCGPCCPGSQGRRKSHINGNKIESIVKCHDGKSNKIIAKKLKLKSQQDPKKYNF